MSLDDRSGAGSMHINEFLYKICMSKKVRITPVSGYPRNAPLCMECGRWATKEAAFDIDNVTVLRWYCDKCVTKASIT